MVWIRWASSRGVEANRGNLLCSTQQLIGEEPGRIEIARSSPGSVAAVLMAFKPAGTEVVLFPFC